MKFKTLRLVAVAGALALGSIAVEATPVTIGFEVTATTGPLAGTTELGTFTFDDVIIPPGGGFVVATGLFSDFAFTWNSIVYDETTANTGLIAFDSLGTVTGAQFGNDCAPGVCSLFGGVEGWLVNTTLSELSDDRFRYVIGGSPPSDPPSLGDVQLTGVVPEPTTLLLLGLGLAGLGFARKRLH